jgi:hypothetical protein
LYGFSCFGQQGRYSLGYITKLQAYRAAEGSTEEIREFSYTEILILKLDF